MTKNQTVIGKNLMTVEETIGKKIIFIGALILLLFLIMGGLIQNLIDERESRRDSVIAEISQKWGERQTITGPFITVPFKTFYKDNEGKTQFNLHHLQILPENLDITAEMKPEIRYRSFFEAVLYNIKMNVKGNFKLPPVSHLSIEPNNILWDKASLALGITDLRGIQEKIVINFNGSDYNASPGMKTNDIARAGVSVPLQSLSPDKPNNFSFTLNLNGSEQINFIPVGETNTIAINSNWPSPSFNGAFLPESREINKNGFSAKWKVLHLNRNFPQFWEDSQFYVDQSAFGLQLILTADIYQKVTRLVKYSIIFLIFTFAAFFLSEIINRQKLHPIQYLFTGIAILIFYTLVLSLSEHINFNYAYVLSATAVTLIISGYAKAIVRNPGFAATIMGILTILYCYLFIILQLEDYALIMGSIGLLIIISLVMYITRKINWYEIDNQPQPE